MTKTFDQICNRILGEMITTPTMAPGQPPKPGQPAQQTGQPPAQQQTGQPPAQQTQNPQAPDLKKISAEMAKLTDASQIEKILTGLINPNAATNNKPV